MIEEHLTFDIYTHAHAPRQPSLGRAWTVKLDPHHRPATVDLLPRLIAIAARLLVMKDVHTAGLSRTLLVYGHVHRFRHWRIL